MPISPRPNKERGEDGFILIAAIWLLVLAGSIAALLMMRSMSSATSAAAQQQALKDKLALESAVETVFADRLFNGARSQWWLLPAEGTVTAGGQAVRIKVSSESGRLDVNVADLALIDIALRGFGVAAAERGEIIERLRVLRAANRRITSAAELDALFGKASRSTNKCLQGHLTITSGLAEPRGGQISPELALAIGLAREGPRSATAEPGAALRIKAATEGRRLMIVGRIASGADQPTIINTWSYGSNCEWEGA